MALALLMHLQTIRVTGLTANARQDATHSRISISLVFRSDSLPRSGSETIWGEPERAPRGHDEAGAGYIYCTVLHLRACVRTYVRPVELHHTHQDSANLSLYFDT